MRIWEINEKSRAQEETKPRLVEIQLIIWNLARSEKIQIFIKSGARPGFEKSPIWVDFVLIWPEILLIGEIPSFFFFACFLLLLILLVEPLQCWGRRRSKVCDLISSARNWCASIYLYLIWTAAELGSEGIWDLRDPIYLLRMRYSKNKVIKHATRFARSYLIPSLELAAPQI